MALLAFHLPTLNACLNALAALLLVCGFVAIRRGQRERHKRLMLAAFATSTVFLVCYLIHKATAGHTPFPGSGTAKTIYLAILLTHTILAASVVPLALLTMRAAFTQRFERHKKLARVTFPIWLYVSITGVVIWWFLYSGTFDPPVAPASPEAGAQPPAGAAAPR
ncbi:MAG: DUF420 domain-containing protein [Planctomycetes bacterium]|nr:DUF420 domain-containing protein [Planctomycetota bacterium]